MYGATMGALNVYIRKTSDAKPDNTQKKIWSAIGDHGNKWFCTFLDTPSTEQYSIVFESVRGPGYQSDVALDDIKFIGCGGTESYSLCRDIFFVSVCVCVALRVWVKGDAIINPYNPKLIMQILPAFQEKNY